MSMSHMIILGIIALIVIPPEKLPELAKQIAKFIYELKRSADQIMGDLKQEALFKPEDILDQNIKDKLSELHRQLNEDPTLQKQTTTTPANSNVSTSENHAPTAEVASTKDIKKNDEH